MKTHLKTLTPVLVSLLLTTAGVLSAQVTNPIRAHVNHSFVIGDTTLPPGDYTFRMMQDSDLSAMTATSDNDKISVEFLVRSSTDDHTPRHSQLIFRKYGNTEFLSKIYEGGTKTGEALTEMSKQEERLAAHGQHAAEHSEEQK